MLTSISVSNLIGKVLDYAFAMSSGYAGLLRETRFIPNFQGNWNETMPHLVSAGISITKVGENLWMGSMRPGNPELLRDLYDYCDADPLVAGMRCKIANTLGQVVQIPCELAEETELSFAEWIKEQPPTPCIAKPTTSTNLWHLVQRNEEYVDFSKEVFDFADHGNTSIDVTVTFSLKTRTAYCLVDLNDEDGNTMEVNRTIYLEWEKALAMVAVDVTGAEYDLLYELGRK